MSQSTRPSSYLPAEVIQPVTPRALLGTWIAVFVLVLLVNVFVAPRMLEGGRNLAGWIIGHKWRMLLRLDHPVDDLVLGDSSCNQGVNPAVLAPALGDRTAINLCTIGDMLTTNDAWMLQTYIERHGAPRRVVIVHVYDIWSRDFDWSRVGSVPVGYFDLRKLRPAMKLERWQLRSYLESRYFPLYSSNRSLQTRLRIGAPEEAAGPRHVDSLGFLADTVAYPDSVEQDFAGHLRFLARDRFHLSADNARGLRRIAALAEQHDFDVYLASAPVYERLAQAEPFQRYLAEVAQALDSVTGPRSRVRLVFTEPMAFPASEMQNADHLVHSAADRFTRALAEEIVALERLPPR